jgi:predicted glycosyltransferase
MDNQPFDHNPTGTATARALRPALASLRTTAKRQQTVMQDVLDMTKRVTQAVKQRVEAIVQQRGQGRERKVQVAL